MSPPDKTENKISFVIFAYWHDKGWKQFVGATVKIWDLARNLADLGERVVLFLPKYRFDRTNIPFTLIEIPFLDFPLLRSLSFSVSLVGWLLRHGASLTPDVVYVRRGISLVPAIFARIRKSLLFFEVNDDPYSFRGVSGVLSRISDWLSLKTDETIMAWSDAIFVITQPLRDKIIKKRPELQKEKMHVLPSGANTDLFRPMDKISCRKQLGIELDAKYICFLGTLLKHQGVDVLMQAAPLILDSEPNARFVIIGEGPMRPVWEPMAARLLLATKLRFTGQIRYEEIPMWINAMDICTAPFSAAVGLSSPVKIFDYMACARPVVSSRIVGTTDIFEDSNAIALVPPEDPHALASAVMELLSNEEKANAMGRSGRMLVERLYSRRNIAQSIRDIARDLLNIGSNTTGLSV